MATVTTDDITFEITTMRNGRNRQLAYANETASIPYAVKVTSLASETDDLDTIEDWILAGAMTYLSENPVHNLIYTHISEVETLNSQYWRIVANYSSRGEWGIDEVDMEFDTSSGTLHITSSIATSSYYGDKAHPGGTIGYDPNTGDVSGVDIPIPQFNWSIRRTLRVSTTSGVVVGPVVTPTYIQTLFYTTGCVNSDAFWGFAPGTTLFLGAGGKRTGDTYDITYRFSSMPNRTAAGGNPITIPGLLETPEGGGSPAVPYIDKLGWEYLWVQYKNDVLNKTPIKVPIAAYCEQVVPYAVFANLGLY